MQKMVLQQIRIGNKVYPRGLQDFSEEAMKHPTFSFYVRAGRIVAPNAQAGKGLAKAEAAMAQRKAMEEKYGVPRAAAPEAQVKPVADESKKSKK